MAAALQLTREDFAVIARTCLEVFPEAQLGRRLLSDSTVLGHGRRLAPYGDLEAAHERVRADCRVGPRSAARGAHGLAMLYAGDLHPPRILHRRADNRDDRPVLEFMAPGKA